MDTIRTVIADGQAIARSGLQTLLAPHEGIELIGEARDGDEAMRLAASLEPDVVLLDLHMPGIDGIETTRRIHRARPHIGILVLTLFEDDSSLFPAIRAGARGYLLKSSEQDELLRAIQTVAAGGAVFSPGIAQRVLGFLSITPPDLPSAILDELTPREREILELIAQGRTNAEIATRLALSPKTVSNNISNLLSKVHAPDRGKLMLMALVAGMGRPTMDFEA